MENHRLPYPILPYPKGDNIQYNSDAQYAIQEKMF